MSRKPPASSKISKIDRPSPVAYARRMKTGAEIDDDAAGPVTKDESKKTPEGAKPDAKDVSAGPTGEASKAAGNAGATTGSATDSSKATTSDSSKAATTDSSKAATGDPAAASASDSSKAAASTGDTTKATGDSSKASASAGDSSSATTADDSKPRSGAITLADVGEAPKPPAPGERSRANTLVMPMVSGFGVPPAVPTATPAVAAAAPVAQGAVEDPTHMPSPREIPGGQPSDPAAPPGRVPRGDSRSLRRGDEFALVYRVATFVISRFGGIGKRGQWRVVEYPTSSSASHAYAKECSRFVTEGFSDYRD